MGRERGGRERFELGNYVFPFSFESVKRKELFLDKKI
jgi:hypothetical protein